MDLEVQVQPHLACFEILECNWDQDHEKGYIEVDFGEGRICGFHCHAKELSFAAYPSFWRKMPGIGSNAF